MSTISLIDGYTWEIISSYEICVKDFLNILLLSSGINSYLKECDIYMGWNRNICEHLGNIKRSKLYDLYLSNTECFYVYSDIIDAYPAEYTSEYTSVYQHQEGYRYFNCLPSPEINCVRKCLCSYCKNYYNNKMSVTLQCVFYAGHGDLSYYVDLGEDILHYMRIIIKLLKETTNRKSIDELQEFNEKCIYNFKLKKDYFKFCNTMSKFYEKQRLLKKENSVNWLYLGICIGTLSSESELFHKEQCKRVMGVYGKILNNIICFDFFPSTSHRKPHKAAKRKNIKGKLKRKKYFNKLKK